MAELLFVEICNKKLVIKVIKTFYLRNLDFLQSFNHSSDPGDVIEDDLDTVGGGSHAASVFFSEGKQSVDDIADKPRSTRVANAVGS